MKKLDKNLFGTHNANSFPLDQIISFVGDCSEIVYRDWSSSMKCDYCDSKGLEYYREEVVYYNQINGFYLSDEDIEDDDCVDFAVYRCPKCGKWFTYIE